MFASPLSAVISHNTRWPVVHGLRTSRMVRKCHAANVPSASCHGEFEGHAKGGGAVVVGDEWTVSGDGVGRDSTLHVAASLNSGIDGAGLSGAAMGNTPHFNGVLFYVAFDKAGSTTLRRKFAQREMHYNWPRYGPNMEPCHISHKGKSDASGNCSSVPDGDIIVGYGMRGPPTFCESSHRHCRYFTLLRHPVSRIRSAYNYFCVRCSEGGRQCSGSEDPTRLTCPNMTIIDYARYFGSIYTRAFAPKGYALLRDTDSLPEKLHAFTRGLSQSLSAVQAADAYLHSILVLLVEEDLMSMGSLERLGGWIPDPWFAPGKGSKLPTENQGGSKQHARSVPTGVLDALAEDIELWTRCYNRSLESRQASPSRRTIQ